MPKNAHFLAKIGADTAENEQHFAEILPIGRRVDRHLAGRDRGDADGGDDEQIEGRGPMSFPTLSNFKFA